MQEKIGGVILEDEFYSGEDFYSDGRIEDRLLQICKNGKQDEVLRTSSEWPVLYHLSDIRENLLDWYPFTKQDDILEIGSGCGALTGLLSRKAGSVTGNVTTNKLPQTGAKNELIAALSGLAVAGTTLVSYLGINRKKKNN